MKHNLFVAGTTTRSKRKAPPTEDDDDDEVQVTEPVKTAPARKLPAKATRKKIKFAVVDEEPPNDDVVYVKVSFFFQTAGYSLNDVTFRQNQLQAQVHCRPMHLRQHQQ